MEYFDSMGSRWLIDKQLWAFQFLNFKKQVFSHKGNVQDILRSQQQNGMSVLNHRWSESNVDIIDHLHLINILQTPLKARFFQPSHIDDCRTISPDRSKK